MDETAASFPRSPAQRDVRAITAGYASGGPDPVAVVEDALALAELAGERYSALAELLPEPAHEAAAASAERWRRGAPIGPLDGVPVSIKESIPARGTGWRHGSAVHEASVGVTDSAPVSRLREAGAIVFAKTAMPELGMVASGLSSLYGVVRNPWDPDRTPGGSSSGAGVFVAAGVGPLALGTDLGGSVRIPAAHTGVYGFKPTQGRIAYAPASSVRTPGPLARTVDDLEALLTVVGVADPGDASCLPGAYRADAPLASAAGLRVALVLDAGAGLPTGDIERAAAIRVGGLLADAGAEVVPVPGLGLVEPDQDALLTTFRMRVLAELHAVPLSRRSALLPELAEFVEDGYAVSGLAYAQAMDRVSAARERVRVVCAPWDLVVTPALAVATFPAELAAPEGARSTIDHAQFTAWFNQTGDPAGVVPAGLAPDGTPVAVQVVGNRFDDARVVAAMRLLEVLLPPLDLPFVRR